MQEGYPRTQLRSLTNVDQENTLKYSRSLIKTSTKTSQDPIRAHPPANKTFTKPTNTTITPTYLCKNISR